MCSDTDIGGPASRFPNTQHSAVLAARSTDAQQRSRALQTLISTYWKPAYKYLRFRWRMDNEQAKDATQAFFAEALERGLFERFDPARASFRTYLRTCLDGHASNAARASARLKRGGSANLLSLDFDAAEREFLRLPSGLAEDFDACFEREWLRRVFELAVERVREICTAQKKETHFAVFAHYDLSRLGAAANPTYEELAAEFSLPKTQITNYLAWARRAFREAVLDVLREITASDDEFRQEAQRVLGTPP